MSRPRRHRVARTAAAPAGGGACCCAAVGGCAAGAPLPEGAPGRPHHGPEGGPGRGHARDEMAGRPRGLHRRRRRRRRGVRVQVTRRNGSSGHRAGAIVLVLACAAAAAAPARAGDTEAGYVLNHYSDVDGVSVDTHYLDVDMNPWRSVALALHFVHDRVVIPAIDAPAGQPRGRRRHHHRQPAHHRRRRGLRGLRQAAQLPAGQRRLAERRLQLLRLQRVRLLRPDGHRRTTAATSCADNLNLTAGAGYSWDDIEPLADADTDGRSDFRTHRARQPGRPPAC